jgi:hypothetical protein
MPRKQPRKIGKIQLTEAQRELIAGNVDSEFFKLITDVIIPARMTQIALTSLHASQNAEDLKYYQGMTYLMTWFGSFITGEAEKVDTTDYENDDAEDDDDTDI